MSTPDTIPFLRFRWANTRFQINDGSRYGSTADAVALGFVRGARSHLYVKVVGNLASWVGERGDGEVLILRDWEGAGEEEVDCEGEADEGWIWWLHFA